MMKRCIVEVMRFDLSKCAMFLLARLAGGMCLFLLVTVCASSKAMAQAPVHQVSDDTQQMADIEKRLNILTTTLTETQKDLQQSLLEIKNLRAELNGMHPQSEGLNQPEADPTSGEASIASPASDAAGNVSINTEIQNLHEQQEVLQAEIKQHEQTKVETDSRYSLRVTGIALFNAFSNAGVVDTAELPELALPRVAGASHGSNGATLRQTIFGVAASGPIIAGAHTSAVVNADFFGGITSNGYGYNQPSGFVRMRDGEVALAWSKSTIAAGYTVPLISPLSPTSYASIAEPSLAGSGNLWMWSPQVRFEQRIPLSGSRGLSVDGGVIYPSSSTYSAIQLVSPVEASRRPGVEGRITYHSEKAAIASAHPFAIGIGVYKASQIYSTAVHIGSWAVTGDWQIPLTRRFDLSGEVYRGRAIGGLGGGLYKDIIIGTDYQTGLSRTVGVDTAGGWSQLKLNLGARLEANAAFGLDDAFAGSFDSVILPAPSTPAALAARNDSVVGNLVFRPRASLIFSPEYRRLMSWSYTGAANVANIFTLSAGYQF